MKRVSKVFLYDTFVDEHLPFFCQRIISLAPSCWALTYVRGEMCVEESVFTATRNLVMIAWMDFQSYFLTFLSHLLSFFFYFFFHLHGWKSSLIINHSWFVPVCQPNNLVLHICVSVQSSHGPHVEEIIPPGKHSLMFSLRINCFEVKTVFLVAFCWRGFNIICAFLKNIKVDDPVTMYSMLNITISGCVQIHSLITCWSS